ncbi:MAG: hypothetical protein ACK4FL_00950 [Microgenomates group bacterium]
MKKISSLNTTVNEQLDNCYENDYGKYLLGEAVLRKHMEEVKLSLMVMAGLAGFFHFADQMVKGKISPELYYGFQALVKIVTHIAANFVDFYSQYKMFLQGDNFFQQAKDLIKKLGWREYSIFATGAFLDSLSEQAGVINPLLGAGIFGAEPIVGTALTTVAGSSKNSNSKTGHKFSLEKIKDLAEMNPAVLGRNTGAFLTFLTSVGLLGIAGGFHNPLMVVLAGGVAEPVFGALATEIFMRRTLRKKRRELTERK